MESFCWASFDEVASRLGFFVTFSCSSEFLDLLAFADDALELVDAAFFPFDVFDFDELPKPKVLQQLGEPFRPWRSLAAWYCWRAVDLRRAEPELGHA